MSSVWSSLRGRQKRVENKGMNNRYREKKHYSVLPYYVIGASWIIFALLFPMYTVGHYVVIALISVAEFVILRGIIPPKIERIALPYEPPKTGIADVDDTMELGAEYIRKFDEIGGELYAVSPALSDKLADIRELMSTIFEYVAKNPDRLPRIRRFTGYYLPTLEKLTRTYVELSHQKLRGENIQKTLTNIEGILDTIKPAFENLYNSLYEDKAVDISAEITVLENLIEKEGLGGDKQ